MGESMHNGDWILAVAFSPDGRVVVTGRGQLAQPLGPYDGKTTGRADATR